MDVVQVALQDLERLLEPDLPDSERKSRLVVLKERFRIENVFELAKQMADDGQQADEESETLTEIRGHLEPLGLAPEGTPLPELARLAALKITEK
jgi:hypothetical protein